VRDDGQRDAREGLLRHACEDMVSARVLRVNRSSVAAPGTSLVLDDLLSTHILTEWQSSPVGTPDQYVLTFAHHVLFDYAVARLLFRGTPEKLLTRLTDDPELVIVVRPSLLLHFQHLWTVDPLHAPFLASRLSHHGGKPNSRDRQADRARSGSRALKNIV
jgi:hypothetical protein